MSDCPLTDRFPGTSVLPHVSLGDWPTPVAENPVLARDLGVPSLWIKRDDVSARAYGGNKVRKLEFLLGAARDGGCRSVLTFGAYGSNHVLATAIHGAALGLDVHAVLMPQPDTAYLRRNLLACAAAGVTLHLAESFADAPRRAVAVRTMLVKRDGIEPMVVPFGGTNALGTIGFVNAAFELSDQIAAGELPEPDVLYVPMGSIGTAAGLAIGLAADGIRTRVVAVRVVPESVSDPGAVQRTVAEAITVLREADPEFPLLSLSDLRLHVCQGFLGEGYAVPTAEAQLVVKLAAATGVSLETTYTGKALAALVDDASSGRLTSDKVLFWNTYNSRPVPQGDPAQLPEDLRGFVGE